MKTFGSFLTEATSNWLKEPFDISAITKDLDSPITDKRVIRYLDEHGWRHQNWLRPDNTLSKGGKSSIRDRLEIANNELQRKKNKKEVKTYHSKYLNQIGNMHQHRNLVFKAMPMGEFQGMDKIQIYKSTSYNRAQASAYYVGKMGNKVVYIRKSNHWGRFYTNVYQGTPQAQEMGWGDRGGDDFGRVGAKSHDWELEGGKKSKDGYARISQVGYIVLDTID